MTNYAPQQYVTTLKAVYGDPRRFAQQHPGPQLSSEQRTILRPWSSNLGLSITPGQYKFAVVAEAILTFRLSSWRWLTSRGFLSNGEKRVSAPSLRGGVYCVAVFMITTVVFVQTSVLLGLPVALHAGISTVESAVGALGFGGGFPSSPAVGTLGFVFGAMQEQEEG